MSSLWRYFGHGHVALSGWLVLWEASVFAANVLEYVFPQPRLMKNKVACGFIRA